MFAVGEEEEEEEEDTYEERWQICESLDQFWETTLSMQRLHFLHRN